MEGRDQKQRGAIGCSRDKDGGPDLDHCAEAGECPDQPERYQHTEGCEEAADHAREYKGVEPGDSVERHDGDAECAECDRRGVGQQRKACSLQRSEAEADEDASADGDGGSETACALKESTECEGDEEKLQAAVRSDSDDALLQESEPSCADGQLIEEEDGEDDPADRKETIACAEASRQQRKVCGHLKDGKRDDQCCSQSLRVRRDVP